VVVTRGEVVESHPDDQPFPSELRLGTVEGKAVHVVVAFELWEDGLRTRRRRR
jgi:hypothetical protein